MVNLFKFESYRACHYFLDFLPPDLFPQKFDCVIHTLVGSPLSAMLCSFANF